MTREQIFPTILMALDLGAACMWWGDWRRVVYWTAAAIITASVTY